MYACGWVGAWLSKVKGQEQAYVHVHKFVHRFIAVPQKLCTDTCISANHLANVSTIDHQYHDICTANHFQILCYMTEIEIFILIFFLQTKYIFMPSRKVQSFSLGPAEVLELSVIGNVEVTAWHFPVLSIYIHLSMVKRAHSDLLQVMVNM